MTTVICPKDAYVTVKDYFYCDETPKTSYVDLEELEDCIISYFDGTLDYVPESCYDRLWMDSTQLIPGHTLLSVMDMQTMRDCLWELDIEHRLVIKAYYGNQVEAQVQLASVMDQNSSRVEAIEQLAKIVHRLL